MLRYFTVNTLSELICLLISLFCLFRDSNPYWKILMYYMIAVYAIESIGIYQRIHQHANFHIYTAFLVAECAVVSIFFYHLFSKYYRRAALLLFCWLTLFMLLYTVELGRNHFTGYPYITSAIMSVVFVMASGYYYLLMMRDEEFRKLGKYPPFWVVNGFLFFYFGGTACNVFYDYLAHEKMTSLSLSIRYVIFNVLNILLYGCWSYAFICRYLQRKSSSSSH